MMDDLHYLILVDENDQVLGKMEKLEVHQRGLLHRAFSLFIFNTKGQLLLQQRADEKYHSPGLWTNTCCSHPVFGEELADAVSRRLREELGMQAPSQHAFSFIYHITFDNGLTEHEFDNVFVGVSDDVPNPDPREVKHWKYMKPEEIALDLKASPESYTEWFKLCFERTIDYYQKLY